MTRSTSQPPSWLIREDAYGRIARQLMLSQSSRRAAIYLVSTLANLAIPLLLLPLLTR